MLTTVVGSNYAFGDVVVQGHQLNARFTIPVQVSGLLASAVVRVVPREERTIPIEIELRDDDYGNFRARWADHEG